MSIELNAKKRSDLGKGASRRLRREGEIPAIVYGGNEPQSLSLIHNDLLKAQEKDGFYASIVTLNIEGQKQDVVIKDIQRHPAKPVIQHVDFQRADNSTELTLEVPLLYINGDISPAVKLQGGIIQIVAKTLRVRCLPSKLPQSITVDLKAVNNDQILHISDIQLPEGVRSADLLSGADRNHPVVIITGGRKG